MDTIGNFLEKNGIEMPEEIKVPGCIYISTTLYMDIMVL